MVTAAAAVISFLICGIPFGLLIANKEAGVDVRKTGSGNIGMTNVARSVGKKAAVMTLLCDLGKGLVCMAAARFAIAAICLGGDVAALEHTTAFGASMSVVYLGCVFGHIFSPYLGFHGGKGISVGFGAALGLYWPVGAGLMAVFIAFAVPSRYVSLGSVCAAVSLPIWCAVFGFPPASIVPVALVAIVVIWAHRGNIKKLMTGTESKFAFHHDDKDKRE